MDGRLAARALVAASLGQCKAALARAFLLLALAACVVLGCEARRPGPVRPVDEPELPAENPPPDGPKKEEPLPVRTLDITGTPVEVEVAHTPSARGTGLMFREDVPEMHGMLFAYPENDFRTFWMLNTSVPLDVAFLGDDGVILQIESMDTGSETSHHSRHKIKFALEVRRGWFRIYKKKVGDRVDGIARALEGVDVR